MFSDMPPTPSDPVRQLKIGGIPWTTRQAVLSLSAYAYQKAISLVLAEFLGIQLCSGLIRPTTKARLKLLTSLNEITEQSRKAFNGYSSGKTLKKSDALLATLRRIDGVIQGWGKHYWFCNDEVFFQNLDAEVIAILRRYLGLYSSARKAVGDEKSPALLGVELLGQLDRKGFEWPSTAKPTQQTAPQPAEGHSEPLYPEGRADSRISARYALPKTGAAHGRPPDAPNPR